MTDTGKNKGHNVQTRTAESGSSDSFVLEKHIFSNVFERDIRRVYIYKKAERLARALHVIGPAFASSPALRQRADKVAVTLVDAAVLPPGESREALSRELLALSSLLSIASTSGMLSVMNADLISREARTLLQEVAGYEEPRLFLEESPSLAELAKSARENSGVSRALPVGAGNAAHVARQERSSAPKAATSSIGHKGHVKDNGGTNPRRDAILSILGGKGPVYIKDISTMIRDVSEKTIQRELQKLVDEGKIMKAGERRWTTYSLAS